MNRDCIRAILGNPRLLNRLANQQIEIKNFEAARFAFERAIDLEPGWGDPYNGLSHVYFVLGRLDLALAAVGQAIELAPANALARQNLGYLNTDIGRQRASQRSFLAAIELDPCNSRPWYGLGLSYRCSGRIDQAIASFERAITLDPIYVGPRISLAGALLHLGDESEFERHITACTPWIETESDFTRARFESVRGERDRALQYLRRSLKTVAGYRSTVADAPDFGCLASDRRFQSMIRLR